MTPSPSQHRPQSGTPLLTLSRLFRLLFGCGVVGLIVIAILAAKFLFVGGDATVGKYMRPPWLYIEWLLPALIAFPFSSA